jgi:hypothetical protein
VIPIYHRTRVFTLQLLKSIPYMGTKKLSTTNTSYEKENKMD